MRDPQRSNKATTPFNNYKPSLDTLEDRSLPGNSMLGLAGLSMPFTAMAQKAIAAAPKTGATAKTPAKTSVTSLANLSITAASVQAAFSGGKQSILSKASSSASSEIQTSLSSNTGSTKVDTSESWEAIMNRMLSSLASGNTANNLVTSSAIQNSASTSFIMDSGTASSGSVVNNGSTNTGSVTPTKPTYDSETLDRLYEYAQAGTVGYLQGFATAPVQLSATQQAAADALKTQFPNLLYQTNTEFGTPTSITNGSGMLTGPKAGDPVTIARNYLTQLAPFLGVQPSDLNTLALANSYGETVSTSATRINYVYLQSTISGIPVYGATTSVFLKGDGSIGLVNNGMIPNLQASVNTTTPTITAAAAAAAVAQHLGLTVSTPIVQRIAPSGAQKKGTVSDGGFAGEDIKTELALVPAGLGSTRLAWHVTTTLKNDYMFDFYIDATNGNVLLRNSLTDFDSYRVLPVTAKAPDQGTISVVTNPADPVASPWGWHDTNGKTGAEYTITSGNNVNARARRDSTLPGSLGYLVPSGGKTNTYNFTANFKNDPFTYQAAAATQLFYAVNTWHDVSYRYGFTEVAGNAQQNNYGRGNLATGSNDAVQAFAQDEADRAAPDTGRNNAFMSTPPDGGKPSVHMFVFDLTGPNRDGDFDSTIVFHELGHALIRRLVNGGGTFGSILSGPQAGALSEGGADYNGLFFTTGLAQASNFNKATPMSTYVLGQSPTGLGIRRFPYSANKDINPLTYNDFDPSQVDVQFPFNPPFDPSQGPVDESHNAGEIWANTLWQMTANLVDKYGFSSNIATGTAGNNRAYQLYISGLKMTPAFPSLLDDRNAIIAADNMLYGGANLPEIWSAFADRGMGANAFAGTFDLGADNPGWQSDGIIEDFTVPDGLVVTPPPPPSGGDGSSDFLYEPNETSNVAFNLGALTGANSISDLQVRTVASGKAADRDWFRFTPTKAGTLSINLQVSPQAGDLDIKVYRSTNGSASNLVEVGAGQGTHRVAGANETVTVAVGAGISYFFVVQGFNGGKGNYNLNITAPS